MPPVKGRSGLTATIFILLAIFGLLVLAGAVFWLMKGGGHKPPESGRHGFGIYQGGLARAERLST